MVRPAGFEPATFGSGVKRHKQIRLPERRHIEMSKRDGIRLASMVLPVWKDLRGTAVAFSL